MVDRMTEEQAAALLAHIDELSAKLSLADDQAKKNRNLTRWLLGATGLLVVVFVLLGGVVYQNSQNATASCESGNRRLEGTRAQAQEDWRIQDAAAEAQGYTETDALRKFYADRLEWQLEELYPYRDCTDLGKKIPTPGEPPSFAEALKQALEDEAR